MCLFINTPGPTFNLKRPSPSGALRAPPPPVPVRCASPVLCGRAQQPEDTESDHDPHPWQLSWVSASHRGNLMSLMNASNCRPKPILDY